MRFQTMISLTKSRRRRRTSCEGGFVKKKKSRAQPQQQHQYIPEDIVVDILQKLPVTSLLRFRCVSKQWCELISKTRTHRYKLLITTTPSYNRTGFQSIDQTTQRVENIVAPKPWKDLEDVKIFNSEIFLFGTCDGLILVECSDDLYLWNPSIRYLEKMLTHKHLNPYVPKMVGGLFFHSVDNEYKIVIAQSCQPPVYGSEVVMVGSPRNKSWTHIHFPYSVMSIIPGPVLNNRLHWVASKRGKPYGFLPKFIIYFDGKSDKFLTLSLPPGKEEEGDFILNLTILDGCLCMSRTNDYDGDKVDVLVMKDYGVKESWAVLLRIDGVSATCDFHPLFYVDEWKSKVLIHFFQDKEIYGTIIIVYDTNTKSRSDSKYLGRGSYFENVYEETLIRPPARSDWEELDSRGEAFYVEKFRSGRVAISRKNKYGDWSGGSHNEIYRNHEIYWEEEEE